MKRQWSRGPHLNSLVLLLTLFLKRLDYRLISVKNVSRCFINFTNVEQLPFGSFSPLSKATGLDNIYAKIIRECADLQFRYVISLMNPWSLVYFRMIGNVLELRPLFKQGEPSDLYRLLHGS